MKESFRVPKYAIALTTGFCVALVGPLALWTREGSVASLLWLSLYSLLACSLSVELTELLLSFLWKPRTAPLCNHRIDRSTTAVVMTLCDDADSYALSELVPLAKAGYPVFLLDDSASETEIPEGVRGFVAYRRRNARNGAKAGNLNDWLSRYGNKFANLVLLDADSAMSPEAVDALVRAALHPANPDVAVLQSKVRPRATDSSTLLSFVLGIGARPRARVLERVHSRLGILLSFGHNQLVRISALNKVGGFSEVFSSEDTALSLSLSSLAMRTELVDVWSYDTEPSSLQQYVRRTVRWARQTVELFSCDWRECPIRMKILLCWHLLSYCLPVVGFALLLASLAYGPRSLPEVLSFLQESLLMRAGYLLYGLTIWMTTILLMIRMSLQLYVALAEGVPALHLFVSLLVSPSLQAALTFPVAFGMARSALGARVAFLSTNSREAPSRRKSSVLGDYLLPATTGMIGIGLIGILAYNRGAALVGFNFLWVTGFAVAPLVLPLLCCTQPWSRKLTSGGGRE